MDAGGSKEANLYHLGGASAAPPLGQTGSGSGAALKRALIDRRATVGGIGLPQLTVALLDTPSQQAVSNTEAHQRSGHWADFLSGLMCFVWLIRKFETMWVAPLNSSSCNAPPCQVGIARVRNILETCIMLQFISLQLYVHVLNAIGSLSTQSVVFRHAHAPRRQVNQTAASSTFCSLCAVRCSERSQPNESAACVHWPPHAKHLPP